MSQWKRKSLTQPLTKPHLVWIEGDLGVVRRLVVVERHGAHAKVCAAAEDDFIALPVVDTFQNPEICVTNVSGDEIKLSFSTAATAPTAVTTASMLGRLSVTEPMDEST